jgi:predicted ATPase
MPVELTDEDAPIVGGICRRLDGLALAIELAAGRVNAHGFRGTAALLNTRFRLEWQGRRTALPRHQTLNAMLDWSYSLLSEQERLSLARLSIFVGPFTASAAEDVVIDPDGEPFCVPEVVTSLVERSLLSVSHEGSTTKYRLLETTREYALRRLDSFGEVDKVAARHA